MNSRRLLNRTIGIETEYSFRWSGESEKGATEVTPKYAAAQVLAELTTHKIFAPSIRNPFRRFVCNGGCFSLENAGNSSLSDSLLEAATPECSSPIEVVVYQAAMREMVEAATSNLRPEIAAVQGNHDAFDHRYGQHESYDVLVAKGIWLWGWRTGLILLMPLVVAVMWFKMFAFAWLGMVAKIENLVSRKRESCERSEPPLDAQGFENALPSTFWVVLVASLVRWSHTPIVFLLWLNIQLFALRPYRKHLLGFLASRCLVDGAGIVHKDGKFSVSCRSEDIDSKVGFGSVGRSRPFLRCDSWLRKLCPDCFADLRECISLFHQRQRIEIATGDSGLGQLAQVVRIGATALVLDLIDGHSEVLLLPRLRNPIESIQRFARDWMVLVSQKDRNDSDWTALDIQDSYACAVRQMLQAQRKVPEEAWQILQCWQQSLDLLRCIANEGVVPVEALGRIDWATKLWCLSNEKTRWGLEAKQKLDLRFHELSTFGYFSLLTESIGDANLISPQLIDRAKLNPPKSSAAAIQRSYLLREFGGDELVLDWNKGAWITDGVRQWKRLR